MTKQELWQIGVAVVNAQGVNLVNSGGQHIPVKTVLGILNSHCTEAQLEDGYEGEKQVLSLIVGGRKD